MMVLLRSHLLFLIFAVTCFRMLRFIESKLPQEEVDALQQIASTMGAKNWRFSGDPCEAQMVGVAPEPPPWSENTIDCDCNFENNTVCHVVRIVLKGYSLPGVLPPELVKLPYLKKVDFAYNYLKGTIPLEWASMQLTFVSVLVNRLSGEIPKELGNITTLTYLCLEANQFSGAVPRELGNLINLNTLMLSSNQLTGSLPLTLSGLRNLTDFRINDNNFSGIIPEFIQNWKQLKRLELHASGLEGPIPSNISLLNYLVQLRISDIKGPSQNFPVLRNMTGLEKLVLRSCNISTEIPAYIWTMKELIVLDVSFNKLVGEIPPTIGGNSLKFVFLTGNLLRGDVPESILKEGGSIDLSYNNFTWQGPRQPACRANMNLHVNLFRSTIVKDELMGVLPCTDSNNFKCAQYSNCFHVNCGGSDSTVKENKEYVVYEGDGEVEGGTSKYFRSSKRNWGFSSTGDFMDDDNYLNTRYTASLPSSNITDLETTARISPLSLTYFYYCLENGKYNVTLQFAEIQFKNDSTYYSLGRRMFNTYIQDKLVLKDFNIEDEAGGPQKSLIKEVLNVSVTKNVLEIRFYWAGKGTTRIPRQGVYGPLISAISVVHESKLCSSGESEDKSGAAYIVAGASAGVVIFIFVALGVLWWKGILLRGGRKKDSDGQDVLTSTFTLKQIKAATNDFDSVLKIGEGGFGPVYKGQLPDGRVIAVKQLSSKSRQGNREFLNEIGMISCLQHPNLVKIHGCCIEGDQLMLVYEYMENNSLACALFKNSDCRLDWPTRLKICIGIAKGLAYLHEESRLKIVHRDIKASNVLLDKDLNPKISDFGLAKLYEDDKTHINTRIAGTIGYMAPEYALWGHLSYKADVYSFGVLALEIVSRKNNNDYMPSDNFVCLLDKAYHLQQMGHLMELVDEELKPEINIKEAEVMVRVALLCTNVLPSGRPTMSEVVSMLEGRIAVPDTVPEPSSRDEDLRFKGMRDLRRQRDNHSSSGSQTMNSTTATANTLTSSSSGNEINTEPKF